MGNKKKKVLFLTGTRADYGKMKPLMSAIEENNKFECHVFVTGMHTLKEFGDTKNEIIKDGFKNIQVYMNQIIEEPMDLVLANTINGFSRYIRELEPDMIILHGDRVEALAGAITGALNNVLVAHIEGGELSGTIDESIRHAISKLAHVHFVSNVDSKKRLLQLGESEQSVFVLGSPDIDLIMKEPSMDFEFIKKRYEIPFDLYSVLMYHPVTTELENLKQNVKQVVDAIIESGDNCIVIHPNNDSGYKDILEEYNRFSDFKQIKCFPSIRFEYFLQILKNAKYLIGNSSAGIHEAPVIGIPSINIGSRQKNRFNHETIINCSDSSKDILRSIEIARKMKNLNKTNHFGDGNSRENFIKIMLDENVWKISRQKVFNDIIYNE
ncbi:UDP-N-acetylglucosamine 2-epimerase [Acetobacterium tundrae]|uniref:UDP-N-acetylglucosamine 2-epimerase (Hydrolyzing) n=1 Tax=Acetobacterium tundrae TaxID=132932 RepID=A0ABR6WKQ0_9FIRM|nr:UDP-N-acetylglucosamine 2-epimerase [Acetobacterium tundrae]MBC3797060.1 UDP-N-acetylglucosamine 2-epimerase (hydrolyzing) [Acetobacterium tundrae]